MRLQKGIGTTAGPRVIERIVELPPDADALVKAIGEAVGEGWLYVRDGQLIAVEDAEEEPEPIITIEHQPPPPLEIPAGRIKQLVVEAICEAVPDGASVVRRGSGLAGGTGRGNPGTGTPNGYIIDFATGSTFDVDGSVEEVDRLDLENVTNRDFVVVRFRDGVVLLTQDGSAVRLA
jgi:hypothetical protein